MENIYGEQSWAIGLLQIYLRHQTTSITIMRQHTYGFSLRALLAARVSELTSEARNVY